MCAKLFKTDGEAGIARFLSFSSTSRASGRSMSYFPAAWNAYSSTYDDCSSTASAVAQVSGLVLWRSYIADAAGLATMDPNSQSVYDPRSGRYYTACTDGHVCKTDLSAADTSLAPGTTLVIVVAVSLLAVLLGVLAYLIWRLEKLWRRVLIQPSREEEEENVIRLERTSFIPFL